MPTKVIEVSAIESLTVAILVLFLGQLLKRIIPPLQRFNIPDPIAGGLIIAALLTVLHVNNIDVNFSLPLQNTFMMMFFSTVGLAASFSLLAQGGKKVIIFLGVASLYIIFQNGIGVSLASAMGLDPLLGLIAGSITLSGGHGTGAAWAQVFAEDYGLSTMEFAMAAATFGLVMGGLIGGPVAERLIRNNRLRSKYESNEKSHEEHPEVVTYNYTEEDRVTAARVIQTLFLILVCIIGASYFKEFVDGFDIRWLKMPEFVYGLFIGVVITNTLEVSGVYKINNETVDILGTAALSLFLAMALMSLQLWEILDLALPLLIILLVQTFALALFTFFITYRVMGQNYDAAVISGGHCGFGMGATPTAVMNMGALVSRHGASPQAFMVVPIVGAFFIDIANLIILQTYIAFLT